MSVTRELRFFLFSFSFCVVPLTQGEASVDHDCLVVVWHSVVCCMVID